MRWLIVVMLLAAGCPSSSSTSSTTLPSNPAFPRYTFDEFSTQIRKGWSQRTGDHAGEIKFQRDQGGAAMAYSYLTFDRIDAVFDPGDPAQCNADAVGASAWKVTEAEVAHDWFGTDTCFVTLEQGDSIESAVFMRGGPHVWLAICVYPKDDDDAIVTCDRMRASWHWN